MTRFLSLGLLLASAGLLAPAGALAQDEVEIPDPQGVWMGELEEESEWERDPANSRRSRDLLGGRGQMRCEGTISFTFRGPPENLRAEGIRTQRCQTQRGGMLDAESELPEVLLIEEVEVKDDGEKLEFDFRPTRDMATRCDTELKWKKDDQLFEGRYRCRARGQGMDAVDRMIEGKFELRKESEGGQ